MPTIHLNTPLKFAEIRIHYQDQISSGSNGFRSFHELKLFLDENPIFVRVFKDGLDSQPEPPMHKDIDLETRI